MIQKVPGKQITIPADDFEQDTNKKVSYFVKEKIRKYAKNLWDEELVLKEGCIVRLLRNIDVPTGWVNSKRARVFRVAADGSYVVLKDLQNENMQLPLTKMRQPFRVGAELFYRCQYPLKLGYATTVHSVQGTTVTGKYYVDLDRSFWESGQAFVALSRPKDLSQLHLLNTHFEKVFVDPYYKDLLKWMVDVDELALSRKPRILNDFPVLPYEENEKQFAVFPPPSSTQINVKLNAELKRQFKHPRKKRLDKKKQTDTEKASESSKLSVSRSLYRASDNFIKVYQENALFQNKLRFGCKFTDIMLNEINQDLQIQHVVDPIIALENNKNHNPDIFQKWEVQIRDTSILFAKYCAQFECELSCFANFVKDLQLCSYSGQEKQGNLGDIFRNGSTFVPVSTLGDGRCFYHAVSYNLTGNSTLANALKILLAYDICKHYELYDDIFSTIASSSSIVMLKVLSYNCWADIEITMGMSLFLQRPITIVSRFDGINGLKDRCYNPTRSDLPSVMIGHVRLSKDGGQPNHFIALLELSKQAIENNANNTALEKLDENFSKISIELPDSDVEMKDVTAIDSDDSL